MSADDNIILNDCPIGHAPARVAQFQRRQIICTPHRLGPTKWFNS